MKFTAVLLLLLFGVCVGVSPLDACAEEEDAGCQPACHLACLDGCSVAPVEAAPPALVVLELIRYRQPEAAFTPRDLDFPPELSPPRG